MRWKLLAWTETCSQSSTLTVAVLRSHVRFSIRIWCLTSQVNFRFVEKPLACCVATKESSALDPRSLYEVMAESAIADEALSRLREASAVIQLVASEYWQAVPSSSANAGANKEASAKELEVPEAPEVLKTPPKNAKVEEASAWCPEENKSSV